MGLEIPQNQVVSDPYQCGQAKLIRQEDEALVGFRIDVFDATERNGKPFVRIVATQNHRLVANQPGRSIDGVQHCAYNQRVKRNPAIGSLKTRYP
jgi:hypothetical protein